MPEARWGLGGVVIAHPIQTTEGIGYAQSNPPAAAGAIVGAIGHKLVSGTEGQAEVAGVVVLTLANLKAATDAKRVAALKREEEAAAEARAAQAGAAEAAAPAADVAAEAEIVAPKGVPMTLKDVDLPGRIRQAGGATLKGAGEFFGWRPRSVTKTAADFTKDQLLAEGWTKERLLHVAEGYEQIARITPANPSAAGRAAQLRAIAKLLD